MILTADEIIEMGLSIRCAKHISRRFENGLYLLEMKRIKDEIPVWIVYHKTSTEALSEFWENVKDQLRSYEKKFSEFEGKDVVFVHMSEGDSFYAELFSLTGELDWQTFHVKNTETGEDAWVGVIVGEGAIIDPDEEYIALFLMKILSLHLGGIDPYLKQMFERVSAELGREIPSDEFLEKYVDQNN